MEVGALDAILERLPVPPLSLAGLQQSQVRSSCILVGVVQAHLRAAREAVQSGAARQQRRSAPCEQRARLQA